MNFCNCTYHKKLEIIKECYTCDSICLLLNIASVEGVQILFMERFKGLYGVIHRRTTLLVLSILLRNSKCLYKVVLLWLLLIDPIFAICRFNISIIYWLHNINIFNTNFSIRWKLVSQYGLRKSKSWNWRKTRSCVLYSKLDKLEELNKGFQTGKFS